MYSIGLIDYFDDKMVTRFLSYAHSRLRAGGELIVGNFHPRNPDKALMDHVLDWRLIHRTEEDMDRLSRHRRSRDRLPRSNSRRVASICSPPARSSSDHCPTAVGLGTGLGPGRG